MIVLKQGAGEVVSRGDTVVLHYRIAESRSYMERGDVLEGSYESNTPLVTTLGTAQLVDEIEQAVIGQRVFTTLLVEVMLRCVWADNPRTLIAVIELWIAEKVLGDTVQQHTLYRSAVIQPAELDGWTDPDIREHLRAALERPVVQHNGFVIRVPTQTEARLFEMIENLNSTGREQLTQLRVIDRGIAVVEILLHRDTFATLRRSCGLPSWTEDK